MIPSYLDHAAIMFPTPRGRNLVLKFKKSINSIISDSKMNTMDSRNILEKHFT